MNTTKEILNILRNNKIRNPKDLKDYSCSLYSDCSPNNDLICGYEGTWVEDIFNIIKSDMELCSNQLVDSGKKYITFSEDTDDILKYTCMFPKSSFHLKEKLDSNLTDKGYIYYTIPKQYLESLFVHKDLIQAGIYKMLPEIILLHGDSECDFCGQYETWTIKGREEFWNDYPINETINVIGNNGVFLSNKMVERLYYTFPWLYGAKIEDYIDIVNKNKLLYENYYITIIKFMDEVHKGNYSSVKKEMEEANINIKIELQKAQQVLLRKGIQTVVSIGFVFLPMALSISEEQKAFLEAVMGIPSLKDIFSMFTNEICNIHDIGRETPFWLMYQWQKKVKIK